MTTEKPRIGLDIDLPDFKPRAKAPIADPAEIKEMAERTGFTARHAPPAPAAVAPVTGGFDARSLRRTQKTARINIATTEENRMRFWTLCQRLGTSQGEEALSAMMDALERDLEK